MKCGGGTKDLDDKSIGMEILMTEAFAKINPTDPLKLAKQAARRKRNWKFPFLSSFSRWVDPVKQNIGSVEGLHEAYDRKQMKFSKIYFFETHFYPKSEKS